MDQQDLIDAMTERMAGVPGLGALFLHGSFGRGTADRESDVDFGALVAANDQAAFVALWKSVLETIVPIVHWAQRPMPAGMLANAISSDWLRVDLMVAAPRAFVGVAKDLCRPLIDPTGLYETWPERAPVIAAHVALARIFLPRASALHARLGLDWPAAFLAATARRLKATLGIAGLG